MTHHEGHNIDTQTSDTTYNLLSVAYHALQGAETYAMYLDDAEEAGDQELVEFLNEVMEQEMERANRAKDLLAKRLNSDNNGNSRR
jgi:rubrerythrin